MSKSVLDSLTRQIAHHRSFAAFTAALRAIPPLQRRTDLVGILTGMLPDWGPNPG